MCTVWNATPTNCRHGCNNNTSNRGRTWAFYWAGKTAESLIWHKSRAHIYTWKTHAHNWWWPAGFTFCYVLCRQRDRVCVNVCVYTIFRKIAHNVCSMANDSNDWKAHISWHRTVKIVGEWAYGGCLVFSICSGYAETDWVLFWTQPLGHEWSRVIADYAERAAFPLAVPQMNKTESMAYRKGCFEY